MNKAYDRVKWSTVLDVLTELGFSPKWVNLMILISQCLSTVTFSVLVNGVPSKKLRPVVVFNKVIFCRLICSFWLTKYL